jgi:UbiD family decarboxylase
MRPFGLRSFLTELEVHRDLKRVRVEVDPRFEIAEIAQRTVREAGPRCSSSGEGLAVSAGDQPVRNVKRIERALGMHPEALGERIVRFAQELNPPTPHALWNARDFFPRLFAFRPQHVDALPRRKSPTPRRPRPIAGHHVLAQRRRAFHHVSARVSHIR